MSPVNDLILGGVKIWYLDDNDQEHAATLGCVASDKDQNYYGLSCSHFLNPNNKSVSKNSQVSIGEVVVAKLKDAAGYNGMNLSQASDIAAIPLFPQIKISPGQIDQLGSISNEIARGEKDEKVTKVGAATGLTHGKIEGTADCLIHNKVCRDCYLIVSDNDNKFSQKGDSGALVLLGKLNNANQGDEFKTLKTIGLLAGIPKEEELSHKSVVCQISFHIEIWNFVFVPIDNGAKKSTCAPSAGEVVSRVSTGVLSTVSHPPCDTPSCEVGSVQRNEKEEV